MTTPEDYVTDEAHGERWSLYLGDSCERLTELPDESVDLSVYSPPFQSLYTYSPSPRDLGNYLVTPESKPHHLITDAGRAVVARLGGRR